MSQYIQLLKGVISSVIVISLTILVAINISPDWLGTWGSLFINAMVPTQIVISLLWRAEYPKPIAKLPQPLKGLCFSGLTILIGYLIGYMALITIGGGLTPPAPYAIMYLIISVPVTLWLIVPLQCWPIKLFVKNEGLQGIAILFFSYLISYLLYKTLFNFSFANGAPFYQIALDPAGLLVAWIPLVISLITLVLILMMVLLDFWPVVLIGKFVPKVMSQPCFAVVSGALIATISGLIYWFFMMSGGMDIVVFMSSISIPAIFGIFIILIMLEGVPALKVSQPWRGLFLIASAIGLSRVMYAIYSFLAIKYFGFTSGSPVYALELWLAPAMLCITFPLMVAFASYFQFWPLMKRDE